MTDENAFNLAREWAEHVREIRSKYSEMEGVSADLISSLPDEWIDANNLREAIQELDSAVTSGHRALLQEGN